MKGSSTQWCCVAGAAGVV